MGFVDRAGSNKKASFGLYSGEKRQSAKKKKGRSWVLLQTITGLCGGLRKGRRENPKKVHMSSNMGTQPRKAGKGEQHTGGERKQV